MTGRNFARQLLGLGSRRLAQPEYWPRSTEELERITGQSWRWLPLEYPIMGVLTLLFGPFDRRWQQTSRKTQFRVDGAWASRHGRWYIIYHYHEPYTVPDDFFPDGIRMPTGGYVAVSHPELRQEDIGPISDLFPERGPFPLGIIGVHAYNLGLEPFDIALQFITATSTPRGSEGWVPDLVRLHQLALDYIEEQRGQR